MEIFSSRVAVVHLHETTKPLRLEPLPPRDRAADCDRCGPTVAVSRPLRRGGSRRSGGVDARCGAVVLASRQCPAGSSACGHNRPVQHVGRRVTGWAVGQPRLRGLMRRSTWWLRPHPHLFEEPEYCGTRRQSRVATQRENHALLVRSHRERKQLTQDAVATACRTNRSAVAHLEQGLRIPKPDLLQLICDHVEVPRRFWQPFTEATSVQRFGFEDSLAELVGQPVNLDGHDDASEATVQKQIAELFGRSVSDRQTFDLVNSILLFYGVRPLSLAFFDRYLTPIAFSSITSFQRQIVEYQKEAVRLFSSLREAFDRLNGAGHSLADLLAPLSPKDLSEYHARSDWDGIEQIDPKRLPDLGYVSAAIARQESAERETVQAFLISFAAEVRANGPSALASISSKQRRRIDSLLRKLRPRPAQTTRRSIPVSPTDSFLRYSHRILTCLTEKRRHLDQNLTMNWNASRTRRPSA